MGHPKLDTFDCDFSVPQLPIRKREIIRTPISQNCCENKCIVYAVKNSDTSDKHQRKIYEEIHNSISRAEFECYSVNKTEQLEDAKSPAH